MLAVTDIPHVQRLRKLEKLGRTHLLFSDPPQNRFRNSSGIPQHYKYFSPIHHPNQGDNDARTEFVCERVFDTACIFIELAFLAHEIGHGTFGHLFDDRFLPGTDNRRSQATLSAMCTTSACMALTGLIICD